MTTLHTKWATFIDGQHRYPTGIAGQLIGRRMLRQHAPETYWTINTLDLQPADCVLEVGFGAGRGLALAAQRAAQGWVTGIDLSATMVQAADRRNRAARRSGRLALLRGNLNTLPFGEQRFDKIFSIHTFYFWPDPLRIFADLVRMLKSDGVIAVTFATGKKAANGEYAYWPLHERVEALVQELQQLDIAEATLRHGPDSRQFNNVAIVMRR